MWIIIIISVRQFMQKLLVILIERERMLARVFQRFRDAAKNLIEINASETIVT